MTTWNMRGVIIAAVQLCNGLFEFILHIRLCELKKFVLVNLFSAFLYSMVNKAVNKEMKRAARKQRKRGQTNHEYCQYQGRCDCESVIVIHTRIRIRPLPSENPPSTEIPAIEDNTGENTTAIAAHNRTQTDEEPYQREFSLTKRRGRHTLVHLITEVHKNRQLEENLQPGEVFIGFALLILVIYLFCVTDMKSVFETMCHHFDVVRADVSETVFIFRQAVHSKGGIFASNELNLRDRKPWVKNP